MESPDSVLLGPRSANDVVCATAKEENDIYEQFEQIFTVLDVGSFQDIFGLRMGDLFEHVVANPVAITIPQLFLANSSLSKSFADILLNFLVVNLDESFTAFWNRGGASMISLAKDANEGYVCKVRK